MQSKAPFNLKCNSKSGFNDQARAQASVTGGIYIAEFDLSLELRDSTGCQGAVATNKNFPL